MASGRTTIVQGQKALASLLEDIHKNTLDWNEAETRFQIIDRLIVDCLGWSSEVVRLERPQGRSYADYELGLPRTAIWEAKRENRTFDLPANPTAKTIVDLPSILALGGEAAEAIQQVQAYCSSRGVEIGVATNGHQVIAFLATRGDGVAPLDGRCFLINGYDQISNYFPQFWQLLSPNGIAEHRLKRILLVGEDRAVPPKLSSYLLNYPQYRYPSDLQTSLRTVSELLLIDVADQPEIERQFYEECYCESGALSQHAMVSKQILTARYASLFSPAEQSPALTPVNSGPGKPILTPEIMAEAISQRPIVLIGDVGVGKTSFLKHLSYVSAFEEFQGALYIYIDLGSQGALAPRLNEFVLNEIETQLYIKYGIDVMESGFVRAVYHGELARFQRGIYGALRVEEPSRYNEQLLLLLKDKTEQRDRHLRESIGHLALGRKKQTIIVLDNADQRDYDIQQEAFVIAQNLAKDWRAAVFIALRPQTFYHSKQSGALTGYPHRIFTIAPPRVDVVVERRLTFALRLATGRIQLQRLKNVQLNLSNIAIFIEALLYSLKQNEELLEFLSNITGGNIRSLIEFVTRFIGSANVDAKKIIEIMVEQHYYLVPVHEFWKAALLGEFSYYDPISSLALNVFDLVNANPTEHFLLPMILGYLDAIGKHKSKEGFVAAGSIISEMQNWGFTPATTENALRRANNKKLMETPQRVTFAEDEGGLSGEMPGSFRISTIGAYHLKRWIVQFAYLDAMSYDTPILDENVRPVIQKTIDSFAISDRYDRALAFRDYLTRAWRGSNLKPTYFDWPALRSEGQREFDRVRDAIDRQVFKPPFDS
jgi:GTPase SAR1 family protein